MTRRNAIVTLAVGDYARIGHDLTFDPIRLYAARCDADWIWVSELSRPGRPYAWEMLDRRALLLGRYERLLTIPVDAIVKRDARNVFELLPPGTFYGVDEYPFDPLQCKPCWEYAMDIWPGEFPRSTNYPPYLYNTGPMLVDRMHLPLFAQVSCEIDHGMTDMAVVNMRLHKLGLAHRDVRPEVFNMSHLWFEGQPAPDILHIMWQEGSKYDAVAAHMAKMGW